MSYINRAIQDVLKNRFETAKSVAITGARQVGKTTMTKHVYENIKRINLKNVVLYNNAKQDPQGFLENFDRPLFIDEIQVCERAITSLKYFCEANENYRVIGAGSLLGVKLARFESSFPVGKVRIAQLYPMSFDD